MSKEKCPSCGVEPGDFHDAGCDVEQCSHCGGQAVQCEGDDLIPPDDRLRWGGTWPGEAEAVAHGWFAKLTPEGWRSSRPDAPGSAPDLNRVRREMTWDRGSKRFVSKRAGQPAE